MDYSSQISHEEVNKSSSNSGADTSKFVKEIAQYFMDFLETDFHKRRNPKRNVKYRDSQNLLIGLNLSKYPKFKQKIWKAFTHGFTDINELKISKGIYHTNIPTNLLELVNLQIKKVTKEEVESTLLQVEEELSKILILHKDDFSKALTLCLDEVGEIIKGGLVMPFVKRIEKSLSTLDLGDENTMFIMESELTEVLTKGLEDPIGDLIRQVIVQKEEVDTTKLKKVLTLSEVKIQISNFFENFKVTDLFAEVFEIDRNRNILDKQEFYFYFCDLSFGQTKYPVFYIPFTLDLQNNSFDVSLDAQIYINKRAIEFIVQEYNNTNDKKGSLKSTAERILYLAKFENNFGEFVQQILDEIVNYFELEKGIDLYSEVNIRSRSSAVILSNTCYIGLADKSDEALINDYEDILKLINEEDSYLADAFKKLIENFIFENPESFESSIESDWDDLSTPDRLVNHCPIPLNQEQRQILAALNKENCKYITIQGPPGTGKSHTITAIVFDAIQKNQSILVLSDKKEALDVVEDKITKTLNKVRYDNDFQNPILRLGKVGNNYGPILASSAIEGIKNHYKAVKKSHDTITESIEKLTNTLNEDIEAEIYSYQGIHLDQIAESIILHQTFSAYLSCVDIEEIRLNSDFLTDFEEFHHAIRKISSVLTPGGLLYNQAIWLELNLNNLPAFESVISYLQELNTLIEVASNIEKVFGKKINILNDFEFISSNDLLALNEFIKAYGKYKYWLIGFSFNKKEINLLDLSFKQRFPNCKISEPHKYFSKFKDLLEVCTFISDQCRIVFNDSSLLFDPLCIVHKLLTDKAFLKVFLYFLQTKEDINFASKFVNKYAKTSNLLKVDLNNSSTLLNNWLTTIDDQNFENFLRYLALKQNLNNVFSSVLETPYRELQSELEEVATTEMTYLLDKRVINFYENYKATATTIRKIISSKQKFPKDEFKLLKEAFPCILAGIRDYAEYIPLEPEIFDLVIIDEASQVSIAQAFPALLRAKKVVILGDKKQFSNIKAAQARSETNRDYLSRLESSFTKNVSKDLTALTRLSKFDIKTSVLEFFEYINNFNIQLKKHFRGYKEVISYSNKYFYQDSLQVMKIRGKKIEDVLEFSIIECDSSKEGLQNTNEPEINFVISQLESLKKSESKSTVAIITPHTNQQKLFMERISRHQDSNFFFENLELKIMTFDTCQGEERDIVFYSMVATEIDDKLWGVFIKDLNSVDDEEDSQIKAQRLNVGFSRAKEKMHFVLSKDLDKFNGSIGEALRHYYSELENAKNEPDMNSVDSSSPMEKSVLNWLLQTKFYKENLDAVEIRPQFPLGEYIKQLDPRYTHPNYKVDFLIIYKNELGSEHKIVLEYDGFEYHFVDREAVNKDNYEHYYSEEDVYRQKVLEGYGYKFIRLNQFNIGDDPITRISNKLFESTRDVNKNFDVLKGIHQTIEGLSVGDMVECPKCHEIRARSDFRDASLISGYGRFCRSCKGMYKAQISIPEVVENDSSNPNCPSCGSRMILRNGRYGEFYGCSKYPFCKGTRPIKSS